MRNFKAKSWARIGEEIFKTIERRLKQKQIKNGWEYMKKQYSTWIKMTIVTRHGYNPITQTFDWLDERWEEYLKVIF